MNSTQQNLTLFHERLSQVASKIGLEGTYDTTTPNFRKVKNQDAYSIYFRTKGSKILKKIWLNKGNDREVYSLQLKELLSSFGLNLIKIEGGFASWNVNCIVSLKID